MNWNYKIKITFLPKTWNDLTAHTVTLVVALWQIHVIYFIFRKSENLKISSPEGETPGGQKKLGVIHDSLLSYYRFVWNWYLWYSDLDTSPFVCNTALGVLLDAEISKSLVFSENKMLYSQKIRNVVFSVVYSGVF